MATRCCIVLCSPLHSYTDYTQKKTPGHVLRVRMIIRFRAQPTVWKEKNHQPLLNALAWDWQPLSHVFQELLNWLCGTTVPWNTKSAWIPFDPFLMIRITGLSGPQDPCMAAWPDDLLQSQATDTSWIFLANICKPEMWTANSAANEADTSEVPQLWRSQTNAAVVQGGCQDTPGSTRPFSRDWPWWNAWGQAD